MADLFDYISLSNRAAALIYKFGDSCEIKGYLDTPASNPYDPPVRTEITLSTRGVFLKYKDSQIDGTLVRRGDQLVLISAKGSQLPVKAQGRIVRGSEEWTIEDISILKPGPVTMLYKIQVRR